MPLHPDDMLARDEDVGQEHLVELRVAGHLHQRPHLDPGVGHVDDQRGDALLGTRCLGIGAGQAETPGGELGVGRPHLAPGDEEPAVDRRPARRQRGQVASRVGLAEELAPDLLGGEDRRQVAHPLVLCAVGQQGRAHEVDAHPVHRLGRLGAGVLALVERDLHRRRAAPPVGAGPVDAHPAVGGQGRLPLAAPGHLVGQVDERGRTAQVAGEPLPEGSGERLVLFFQREVHTRSGDHSDIGVTLPGPGYGALP